MYQLKTLFASSALALLLSGCSVFGLSSVESAPYVALTKAEPFELRHYEKLILVSTPMAGMGEQSGSFGRLYGYITGENKTNKSIPMTAPVFMDQQAGTTESMSFVMPASYALADTPLPQDPAVTLQELKNYIVATITFNGTLSKENIGKNEALLRDWIKEQNYKVTGSAKAAGYNPPFTIPAFRRNEVLIPVKKP